jgi:hypothetical protein
MALTFPTSGATATTVSEATVNEITSDDGAYWGAQVFIPATFTTGDTIELRWYIWDINGAAVKELYYKKLVGAASYLEKCINFPLTPSRRYRLTIKRTAGVDRTFTWLIVKQTG